ncbi:MAG: hypothetical protein C4567_17795 [Deltaproteobacteria bacterium]|nr:MAG: hypothetical protein C4567_17795 [Deltaproteobacteria bacterium]
MKKHLMLFGVGYLSLVGVLLMAGNLDAASASPAPAQPSTESITPPNQQLPEKIKRCSGAFSGRLRVFHIMAPQDRGTDVTITVKEIDATGTSAKVIYAWTNSTWEPYVGSEECPATISQETESTNLNFTQDGRNCVLSFKDNGEIVLWRYNPPYKLTADMKKLR